MPTGISYSGQLHYWLDNVVQTRVRPRTFTRYRELIRLHVKPDLEKLRLDRLTPQHLDKLYTDKLKPESKLSRSTVHYIHRVLHRAFKDAVERRLMIRNPCDVPKPPTPPKPEVRVFTREDVGRLLKAAEGDRLEALFTVAVSTGMRESELFGLRWSDIEPDYKALHVRQTVQSVRGKRRVVAAPKTETSRRRVPLGPTVAEAFRKHRERQAQERLSAGEKWEENDLVFTNTLGRPLSASNFYHRTYQPLLLKAKLQGLTFRLLRHTCATHLIDQDVPAHVVQKRLGHADVATTLRFYAQPLPRQQEEAAERMDEWVTEARENAPQDDVPEGGTGWSAP